MDGGLLRATLTLQVQIPWKTTPGSVDDFNDAPATRLHEDRVPVDHRVAVAAHAVLAWNFVIGHAAFRQYDADIEGAIVGIGSGMSAHNVFLKARTLINAEKARDAAADSAYHAADYTANRAGSAASIPGAFAPFGKQA